jgi:hypothetical protein
VSLIERIFDPVLLSIRGLEAGCRKNVWVAACGVLAGIAIWIFHLTHTHFLSHLSGILSKIILLAVLVPPFLVVISLAYLLFPDDSSTNSLSGPMSGYSQRQKQRDDKRWRIMIVSGLVAVANLFCMVLFSGRG